MSQYNNKPLKSIVNKIVSNLIYNKLTLPHDK